MSESSTIPASRRAKTEELEKRVVELEKAVKAILSGMKEVEDELGEALMPEGTYFGISFTE